MGSRLPILLISLAINIALGMVVLRGQRPIPLSPAAIAQLPTGEDSNSAPPDPVRPSPGVRDKTDTIPTDTTPAAAQAFTWAQLESEDYREYIVRLRDFAVPERTI